MIANIDYEGNIDWNSELGRTIFGHQGGRNIVTALITDSNCSVHIIGGKEGPLEGAPNTSTLESISQYLQILGKRIKSLLRLKYNLLLFYFKVYFMS